MVEKQNLPAGAPAEAGAPAGLASRSLALDDVPSTADSQAQAGAALADVVKQVGMAVADTQKRLNEIAANTATALASTQVDVIAARSKVYDDAGSLTDEYDLTMKLPLVNFIDPVNYEVSRVRIQGMFAASEIRSQTTTTTQVDGSVSSGVGMILGSPIVGFEAASSTTTEVGTTFHQDAAYGYVRMNAEILPRNDIGVPRPNRLIHGPNLLLVPQEVQDTHQDDDPHGPVTARSVVVKLSYRRRADAENPTGTPIEGQTFAIETPGLLWRFCDAAGLEETEPKASDSDAVKQARAAMQKTSAAGELYFKVHREFPAPANGGAPPDSSQRAFTVAARIGMVQSTVAVAL